MQKQKRLVCLFILFEFIALLSLSFYVVHFKSLSLSYSAYAETEDLTVVVRREQHYFKNNTMWTKGYLYWSDLKDGDLELYGNTSDMYLYEFWDALGQYTEGKDQQPKI